MEANDSKTKCKPSILKIKSYGRHAFTRVLNETIRDPALGGLARAILCYALSMPENWQIHSWQLKQEFGCGRLAIRKAMRELQDAGYAQRVLRRDDGEITGSAWLIRESPKLRWPWSDGE
jgi:hypothetical protein